MKHTALIASGLLLSGLALQPVFFGAKDCLPGAVLYESDDYRLFRFLAKLEKYRGTAYWDNPTVQRILTDGEPDMAKMKSLFIERGLTSDFDAAADKLPKENGKTKLDAGCLAQFDRIEAARTEDLQQLYRKATTSEALKTKTY